MVGLIVISQFHLITELVNLDLDRINKKFYRPISFQDIEGLLNIIITLSLKCNKYEKLPTLRQLVPPVNATTSLA